MKAKAVIWKADRTNDVVVLKKKQRVGNTFKHGNAVYILRPDTFQITWVGIRPFRRYYSTCYYHEGFPEPAPVQQPELFKKGPRGIMGEELAEIFNPWFLRTISAQVQSIWEQIQFWLTIGIAIGIVYLIYALTSGSFSLPTPDVPTPSTPPPTTPAPTIGAGGAI